MKKLIILAVMALVACDKPPAMASCGSRIPELPAGCGPQIKALADSLPDGDCKKELIRGDLFMRKNIEACQAGK